MTIGGTYAALQPRDPVEHHDDHGEGHGDEHEEKEESNDESPKDEDEDKSEEGGEEKASSDDAEKEEAPKEDAAGESQEEGEKKDSPPSGSAEVSNKGMTKSASNTVKHEETSTGKKLRLDSSAGKNIGEGASSGGEDDMSHKQRGMSNTDTRHSTDPNEDPEISKKGEGTAETAKIKGTVDPSRKQI